MSSNGARIIKGLQGAVALTKLASGLSDDARFLIVEMPVGPKGVTGPWGIIPGAQELLDNGCMERDECIAHMRHLTDKGRAVRAICSATAQATENNDG